VPVAKADLRRRLGEQRGRSLIRLPAVELAARSHRPHAIANLHGRPVGRYDPFDFALRLPADRVDPLLHVAAVEDAGDQGDRAQVDFLAAERLEKLRVPGDATRDLDPAPARRGRIVQVLQGEVSIVVACSLRASDSIRESSSLSETRMMTPSGTDSHTVSTVGVSSYG
jgi:hypothetical protein